MPQCTNDASRACSLDHACAQSKGCAKEYDGSLDAPEGILTGLVLSVLMTLAACAIVWFIAEWLGV